MTTKRRRSNDRKPSRPRSAAIDESARTAPSPTAVAAEALRTGLVPYAGHAGRHRGADIPSEDETIQVGDPDDGVLANEYSGEDTPGGSSTTPDQNNVDAIGRVYGLQEEDSGSLRSAAEILEKRDRHRPELAPRRRRV